MYKQIFELASQQVCEAVMPFIWNLKNISVTEVKHKQDLKNDFFFFCGLFHLIENIQMLREKFLSLERETWSKLGQA